MCVDIHVNKAFFFDFLNIFMKTNILFYKLVKSNRVQEAIDIYRWFIPLLELDIHSKLVQNIKLAEVYTEIGTENVRAPRLKLAGEERKRVINIIESALKVRPKLPQY